MFRLLAAAGTAVFLLTVSGASMAAQDQGASTIHACIETGGPALTRGDIKIRRGARCARGERPVSWGGKGRRGLKGSAGPSGPQGPAGDVGPKGDEGPQGSAGPQGPEGPLGPNGPEGAKGETGPEGPQGDTGPQGSSGPQGPPGQTGQQGPQGQTGPQGPQGDAGPQGLQGPTGPSGAAGAPGVSGREVVQATTTTAANPPNGTSVVATVNCPAGKVPLGGGVSITPTSGANATRITLRSSVPTATGWQATALVTANFTTSTTASVTATAICAVVT